jgi:4-hydroxybenzoate polyprenyltransferase
MASAWLQMLSKQWPHYLALIRFDKPIGTLLLLWPTLWALWMASGGMPSFKLLIIFTLGTFLMRSAGCVINDYADRHWDGAVERTAQRPLATGKVTEKEALLLFAALCALAFVLVLFTNTLTVYLSFVAVAIAALYPFMKRYTHLPQAVLGAAFSMGIPMSFAAVQNQLPIAGWLIFIAALMWTVAYDTFYAMVDRDDDLKVGIKSTAILFGDDDLNIIALLQGSFLLTLALAAKQLGMGYWFYSGMIAAAGLCVYQRLLAKERDRAGCFAAFLHNNWVGAVIFAGVAIDFAFR